MMLAETADTLSTALVAQTGLTRMLLTFHNWFEFALPYGHPHPAVSGHFVRLRPSKSLSQSGHFLARDFFVTPSSRFDFLVFPAALLVRGLFSPIRYCNLNVPARGPQNLYTYGDTRLWQATSGHRLLSDRVCKVDGSSASILATKK